MNTNKVYLVIIILLLAVVGFLVVLLFVSDSGKYCVPLVKEKSYDPVTIFGKDSLNRIDSLNQKNR